MQIEDMVTVSSKGQIVIPKKVRKRLGLSAGKKLLLATSDENEILLKPTQNLTLEEISYKTSKVLEGQGIDAELLVDQAIQWARRRKRSG